MKPLADRDPFKIGLAAILAGILLAAMIGVFTIIPFGKKTYSGFFEQSAGLKTGEEVQVAGVTVGKVTGVAIDGTRVKVDFTVSSGQHLGSRTTAAIKVATLLGTHLLALTPAGDGSLPDDTIPLTATTVPFNLQDVLDKGTTNLEQLDAGRLAKLLSTMTDTLSPSTNAVGPALQGVVRLSNVVAARSNQIGGLLAAARSVTNQLSSSSTDLLELMRQTNLVVSEVTARRQAIHTLLVETTRLATNVNGVIGDTKADTGPALHSLNLALQTLRNQDKQLRSVLDTMAPAVRYLANATGNGPYVYLYGKDPILPPDDGIACKLVNKC